MMQGVDVSHYQPVNLPWPAWVAGGLSVAVVQVSHGLHAESHAGEHLAGATAAHVPHIAAYHFLTPGNAVAQANLFLSQAPGWVAFDAVDVEAEPGGQPPSAADVLAFCAGHDAAATRPLVLYGNFSALVGILISRPELKRYPVWWAQYSHVMTAPADLHVAGWQKLGDVPGFVGKLPPYAGNIDLTEWYEIPGATPMPSTPIVTHGPKLGIHSINPGNTLALVKQAVAHGWRWPVVKLVNDASPLVDVKALSPQTITICRYINSNPEWESLNNVGSWPQAKREQFARESIAFLLGRTNAAQLAAVDYWGVVNEPNPRDEVNGYNGIGLALIELVKEADRHNLKLALPAFPQGCPEWNQGPGALGGGMVEMAATGLFGLMKAGGHILDVHEGVFTGQPIDFGYGDVIPRAPAVPGAGSTNFRHRYFYSILESRGEVVPLVVSEFYGGGFYANPPADHLSRFAWYDVRARETPYLLAFLPFTINPDGTWQKEDYGPTYASPELWAYIDAEKLKPNGDNEMQPLFHAKALKDLTIRDAAGNPTTDPVGDLPIPPATGSVVKAGTIVHVYALNVTAGPLTNRAAITADGKSIWNVAGCLQKI